MVQPTARILSTADAADAARGLESPSEVRQFLALAETSASVRTFLDTPEWTAIHARIMGNGKPPTGRLKSLRDVARFMRWTADGLMGRPVPPEGRNAYLHCAMEVDTFAETLERQAAAAGPARPGPGLPQMAKLSFGEAMIALRAGRPVTRALWAGGTYVTAQAGYPDGIGVNANTAAATGLPQGSTAVFGPYLLKCIQPSVEGRAPVFAPWTPDQGDLFADDWMVLARA